MPNNSVVAYLYSEPGLEPTPDPAIWGWEVERVYQDLGGRHQLIALLADAQAGQFAYLLLRRLEELGDTPAEVAQRLAAIEAQGVCLLATEQDYRSSPSGQTAKLLT